LSFPLPAGGRRLTENIVYFELRRRGYAVYVGKNETKEIDFVAVRRGERIYVPVCRQRPEKSDRTICVVSRGIRKQG